MIPTCIDSTTIMAPFPSKLRQRRAEAAQQASEAALAVSAAAHEEHAAASERALRDLRIHVKMKEVILFLGLFRFPAHL